jgi:hypothetical protein
MFILLLKITGQAPAALTQHIIPLLHGVGSQAVLPCSSHSVPRHLYCVRFWPQRSFTSDTHVAQLITLHKGNYFPMYVVTEKTFQIKTVHPNEMGRYGDEPRAGRPRFEFRQRQISFSTPQYPDRHWGPPSPLSKGCRKHFLQR